LPADVVCQKGRLVYYNHCQLFAAMLCASG
jgi:hypothetical protein